MEYVSTGSWFLNDIHFADGREIHNRMGGGGLFAFCGMLQYSGSALFLGAVGTDTDELFGPWLDENHISREGFVYYDNRTTLAILHYEPDGQWREEIRYGPAQLGLDVDYRGPELYEKMEAVFSQRKTKGAYTTNSIRDEAANQNIQRLRGAYGAKFMWELYTEECKPEYLDELVEQGLPCYDLFSLNRTESYSLFSVHSEQAAIERILALGKPCFYRVGAKGSYMIMNDQAAFMPSVHLVPKEQEIDPTGCGNASTGACLWAYCEGYDAYEIASIANVAAAYNAQQYGPYPIYNEQTRRHSLETALQLAAQAK